MRPIVRSRPVRVAARFLAVLALTGAPRSIATLAPVEVVRAIVYESLTERSRTGG